ncbi:MAG TPA: hypothetical protein VMA77_14235 [Solirubrobacteraceae bacterium]|nr:hypothetical protein [Solirubrobacteraceae bacterium]
MRLIPRARPALLAALGVAAACLLHTPSPARASTGQIEIFQDDPSVLANPAQALQQIRDLGAGVVRVSLQWDLVAPTTRPAGFNPTNPASYPGWGVYDQIVNDARQDGIVIDFSVTGPAPLWAAGGGQPAPGGLGQWKPSAADFKQFVEAVGTRYSGTYDPTLNQSMPGDPNDLPRVSFWEIWNEPNFGADLAPQAIKGSTVPTAAPMYRSLLQAGWSGFQSTGHGRDTILIGNLDARGLNGRPTRTNPQGYPGDFSATKPMQFIRTLYCVSSTYKELRNGAAGLVGCPTNAAGSRRFRAQNPGLFNASGFATHPYPVNLPPTEASSTDPDYTEFAELPRLASTLDRIQRMYGSGKRFPIYNNEYGYITNPPNHELTALNPTSKFVSPATAAYYINWAEYISWRNPRIASTMQYLLYDPNPFKAPEYGGFASGLIFFNGTRKPGYDAYRLPLFLPNSTARSRRQSLEVWGCVRPAHYARLDTGTPQQVQIQFQRGSRGAFTTLRTVNITSPRGYFDLRMTFPASGSVRLAWTYPKNDPLLSPGFQLNPPEGDTVYSRTARVTVK